MACPHSKPRGHCDICRMERQERDMGVPEDNIDAEGPEVADGDS